MKIKRIAATCKRRGVLALYDRVDGDGAVEQWIGNGAALYPARGLPYLKMDELCSIFELKDKQVDKLQLVTGSAPGQIDLRDVTEGEVRADWSEFCIQYADKVLMPVTALGVTYLLDRELLEPITARYDEAELWLRRTEDAPDYFAVKNGLMLAGIVMPMTKMDKLMGLLRAAAERYRNVEEETT